MLRTVLLTVFGLVLSAVGMTVIIFSGLTGGWTGFFLLAGFFSVMTGIKLLTLLETAKSPPTPVVSDDEWEGIPDDELLDPDNWGCESLGCPCS